MTKAEIIAVNRDKIAEALVEHYKSVLNCDGAIQYRLYIWSDGELETLEDIQGGNSWLQARKSEPRELFCITTIDAPCFDPWDYSMDEKPDGEEEQEKEREAIIDWLVGEYENSIDDLINRIIKEAEEDE